MGFGNWVITGLGAFYLFSPHSSIVQTGLGFGQPQQAITLVGSILFLVGAYNLYGSFAPKGKH